MFIYLSKFLPPLLYPLGMACLLIVAALFIERRRWRQAILLTALTLLYLGGSEWVTIALARPLEWQYLPKGEIRNADVIVVLAGGTISSLPPRPGPEIDSTGDRLIHAARLFRSRKATQILWSGGLIEWLSEGEHPTEDIKELFQMMGVPSSALVFESDSRNTYESAVACKQILETMGAQKVILVTSAWHMPRSMALFKQQGIDVIPAPTDFMTVFPVSKTGTDKITAWLINLLPSPENLFRTTILLKEYLGLFIYSLRGWI